MYTRILAAIDRSDRAGRVIETVTDLARLTGAAVHVLHAEESGVVYDQVVALEDHETAQAVVDRALARLREEGIKADGEVVEVLHEGVPDAVLDSAREFGADLVVLGPRHHGRIGALLGSSVSHEVALHTPSSLLLVL
ncbi:universal stress protein [Microbispora sp. RL4-1S]|uniref:Universal stress protein n=1 Tax=Microbispora oryzae TaxID=2806554 RepID=A0A940WDW0_9ACTN|nr:universal stress protein [Microbispora oryzae]MBP2703774.1 universal stress protein [Microbispora oryzae]